MKVLRISGILFIQTHQTYPIHSYPCDCFRYTREGLAALFGTKMGFHVIATDYEFPAKIYAERVVFEDAYPSFLNVRLYGEKIGKTPSEYIYDF